MTKNKDFSAKNTGMAAAAICFSVIPAHVFAQDRQSTISELSACRSISDATQRLSCLDQAADSLIQAHKSGELTLVDRTQVREARRSLFGFSGGALPSFLGSSEDREEISSIQTTLVRASRNGYGQWTFHLDDGSEWRQVDNESPHIRAQSGAEVRVRRAAFGSYFLNVGDARAIRVRRQ